MCTIGDPQLAGLHLLLLHLHLLRVLLRLLKLRRLRVLLLHLHLHLRYLLLHLHFHPLLLHLHPLYLHPQLLHLHLLYLLLHLHLLRVLLCLLRLSTAGAARADGRQRNARVCGLIVGCLPAGGRGRRRRTVQMKAPHHSVADLRADPPTRAVQAIPLVPEVNHHRRQVVLGNCLFLVRRLAVMHV